MAALSAGSAAPDFALPAEPGPVRVTLSEHRGEPVVVLFFPLAFSGVCTDELCRVVDDWSRWQEVGATVLGISVDSPFVTRKFAEEIEAPFPILSDFNREASRAWDVLYEDFYGLEGVSKRAAFVVDADGRVTWAWVTEDAEVLPPFEEILEAVRAARS